MDANERSGRDGPLQAAVSDRHRSILIFALSIGRRIGDERWVPMDGRNERSVEVGRELGSELEGDEAELAQIRATLERLRQLRRRINEGRLEADDRALLLALVDEEMMERM